MSTSTISPLLAVAAVVAGSGSLILLLAVGAPGAYGLRSLVLGSGRWMAFAVAALATLGSLYYSEIAHFTPCEMCWFQRIAMYPLAVVLLVAALTRDERGWRYAVPLAALGLLASVYHYQLEMFPEQQTFCTSGVPCSVRLVNEFGFVSLAFMAGCGFVAILALHAAAWRARRIEGE
jgi:disulfide bond formation protein DsbB